MLIPMKGHAATAERTLPFSRSRPPFSSTRKQESGEVAEALQGLSGTGSEKIAAAKNLARLHPASAFHSLLNAAQKEGDAEVLRNLLIAVGEVAINNAEALSASFPAAIERLKAVILTRKDDLAVASEAVSALSACWYGRQSDSVYETLREVRKSVGESTPLGNRITAAILENQGLL